MTAGIGGMPMLAVVQLQLTAVVMSDSTVDYCEFFMLLSCCSCPLSVTCFNARCPVNYYDIPQVHVYIISIAKRFQ